MALARRSGAQGFAPDTAAFAGKGAAPSAHRRSFQVVPDASTEVVGERASNAGVLLFSAVVFAVSFCAVLCAAWVLAGGIGLGAVVAALVVAVLATMSVHIAQQWEKVVVLRLGKFNRVAGPGVVFTIPIVEFYTLRVDQRVSATYFGAEETLTGDLVPINVDAVVFWMVWSAKSAAVEVEDYASAVSWIAQTAMRKAIGRATVAEVATRRDQLDEELKEAIEEKLNPWGITIIDVEIRDIVLPKELQEAMAQEAVAERKKSARMVLAEAEKDISEMLMDASEVYAGDADAMKLRTMHLAYESVEKSGGTLVVPSAFSEGFVPDAPGGEGGGAK